MVHHRGGHVGKVRPVGYLPEFSIRSGCTQVEGHAHCGKASDPNAKTKDQRTTHNEDQLDCRH